MQIHRQESVWLEKVLNRPVGGIQDRQEILQDAWVALWRIICKLATLKEAEDIRSIMVNIVRKRTIDFFRRESVRNRRVVLMESIVDAVSPTPPLDSQYREMEEELLRVLPAREREVWQLRLEGMTREGIAERMGIPLGTMKTLYKHISDAAAQIVELFAARENAG